MDIHPTAQMYSFTGGGSTVPTEMVVVIGLGVGVAWIYRNRDPETGRIHIPNGLWKGVGIFIGLMVVRHFPDVFSMVAYESDAWWPIVKKHALKMATGLRQLVQSMMGE
jgi:hypothetical protein